ncbi:hypothetical protein GC088_11665 [Arthrobacter sp. JZ12]|uniref:hypothetical protein n=1 Tax=Arthrobacter sp. JZ12 TaxID=2654190 RepID=UPI002B45C373|nr:hypothetical protein [Arthrobacter sp. JZ12]WRH25661.1 hypothetical protein GC088_11665 [Arthrobacter sp. JZ12]
MTAQTRRYFVRARSAVAGSLIAAASLTGVGAAPSAAASARLDGVRADLENAVSMNMVTADQAERFYAQLERRILAGA